MLSPCLPRRDCVACSKTLLCFLESKANKLWKTQREGRMCEWKHQRDQKIVAFNPLLLITDISQIIREQFCFHNEVAD